ncbi:hypothetical protein LOD99_5038 [Oopsacas minuta]|uniref:Zinc finger MYM-type protein 1 n=1 Tax=Oopsacas minuta TaxID=111878 RepID=A0AAV7JTQ8_9METZ|nr:hypothetical protein LOD99_5038 [Oopsacas minuta]
MTGGHIDESLIKQYESEKKYWHQVLQRILSVIKMLSSRGLSFRGSDEIVGSVHNAKVLLSFLEENNVSIKDCRGQTYDNASNMSGKYNGMQALIREKNKLAEFIPCCAHSLNLIGRSTVECCPAAVSYFYFVQKLYVFFSASTHRWNLILDVFKKFGIPTLKRLSDTRWSAHHDAVDALLKGYTNIEEVLVLMCEDKSEKPVTRLEAKGLAAIMNRLETGIMLQIWSTILIRFNKTSKCLQDASLDLNTATKLLESLKEFVHSLRSQFMEFKHRNAELSPSNEFMVTNFTPIIDKLVAALNQRQAAYCVIRDKFELLSELNCLVSDQMRDKANDLINIYSDDIEPGFVDEIVQFSAFWNSYISSDSSKTEDTKQLENSKCSS